MKHVVRLVVSGVCPGARWWSGVCEGRTCRLAVVHGQAREGVRPVGRQLAVHACSERLARSRLDGLVALGRPVIPQSNTLRRGAYSLSLPSGSSATSPAACVKLADPASRFFLRSTGASDGKLRVDVTYKSLLGLFTIELDARVRAGQRVVAAQPEVRPHAPEHPRDTGAQPEPAVGFVAIQVHAGRARRLVRDRRSLRRPAFDGLAIRKSSTPRGWRNGATT